MWVICPGDSVKGLYVRRTVLREVWGMPTERLYRGVFCRDLKLISRFLAFKTFKLPSNCPSIQLDIS